MRVRLVQRMTARAGFASYDEPGSSRVTEALCLKASAMASASWRSLNGLVSVRLF